eukprot:TRINITY_DN4659_c0_g2_i1.p1 TRINITY_DN4659_c0_g2~~TRINITY_DN4659_c0_g2_i1.p1  ORF type:complete len:935 (+),score=347.96 TRINITY_DN4659_c0_g2_i1:55-2805(+)
MGVSLVVVVFAALAFGAAQVGGQDAGFNVVLQAEDGVIVYPMRVEVDAVTGTVYVGSPPENCTNKDPDGNKVSSGIGYVGLDFTVPLDGLYAIQARIRTPDSLSDSFWSVLDSEEKQQWAVGTGADFHWRTFAPNSKALGSAVKQRCHSFEKGNHTLRLFVREPGAEVDMVNVTLPDPLYFSGKPEGCSGGCVPKGGSIVRLNNLQGLCGPDTLSSITVTIAGEECVDVHFDSDAFTIVCTAPAFGQGVSDALAVITQGSRSVTERIQYQLPGEDAGDDSQPLIIGVVCGAGGFVLVAGIIVYKSSRDMRQYRKKYHTATIAEDMAEKVAKMELDQLEYLIDIENPSKTQRSFQTIVKALTYYKTYLPEALFTGWKREDSDSDSPHRTVTTSVCGSIAPGAEGRVAIVFTDIQGSTSTWEACPSAMRKSLKIHNSVIRKAIGEFRGYEVKTIGDAFMVAFDDCIDACSFALAVQENLHDQEWPSDLAGSGLPHVSTGPGWKGLRLRLGVNYGEADVEVDPFTGKSDYFGQTVNKAARIENACVPGGVAVSEEVVEMLRSVGYKQIGNPIELPMPRTTLRGVQGTSTLSLLLPQGLAARKNDLTEGILRKQCAQDDTLVRVPSNQQKRAPVPESVASLEMSRYETFELVSSASVGHIRLGFTQVVGGLTEPHQPVNAAISTVLLSSERTEGSVVSLHSNTVIVGWNTMHRCANHLQSAVRFAGLLHKGMEGNENGIKAHIGIGTSNALFGKVGTRDHKFVTVIGECVEMSERIVTTAKELGVFAMSCSLRGHRSVSLDPGLRGLVRPVSTYSPGPTSDPVNVYELRCSAFLKGGLHVGFKDGEEEGVCDWAWGEAYTEAFKNRDFEQMVSMTSDEVVVKVARRIERAAASGTLQRHGTARTIAQSQEPMKEQVEVEI